MGNFACINNDYFDKDTRKYVIQSLALNIINCCNTILGIANTTLLNNAQKLQYFDAKIKDGKKIDHVTPILNDLKWRMSAYVSGVTGFKYLNNLHPDHLLQVSLVSDITFSTTFLKK